MTLSGISASRLTAGCLISVTSMQFNMFPFFHPLHPAAAGSPMQGVNFTFLGSCNAGVTTWKKKTQTMLNIYLHAVCSRVRARCTFFTSFLCKKKNSCCESAGNKASGFLESQQRDTSFPYQLEGRSLKWQAWSPLPAAWTRWETAALWCLRQETDESKHIRFSLRCDGEEKNVLFLFVCLLFCSLVFFFCRQFATVRLTVLGISETNVHLINKDNKVITTVGIVAKTNWHFQALMIRPSPYGQWLLFIY